MVLTTPLIAELARRGPVDVVATPASAPLLANNPDVRRLLAYDKRGAGSGIAGLLRTAAAVRSSGGDASAYCVQGSLRTAAFALVAGYRQRVGFETSSGKVLYTRRAPYHEDHHHAERVWSLAARDPGFRASAEQLRPRLFPGVAERAQVDVALGTATRSLPLVAVAPGSIWATKRWPMYPELARQLRDRATVVVVGGAADASLAREIVEASSGTAIDATGTLSLLASAELIGRCAVLVTNDSAPQHLASAMSTPTVALFGPTVPDFGFGPLAPRSVTLGRPELACRPCDRHGPRACPLGHWKCMRDLTPESVVAQVHERLSLTH